MQTDISKRNAIYANEYISEKSQLWKTFLRKINGDTESEFLEVVEKIKLFIEPVVSGEHTAKTWRPDLWKWEKL